MVKSPMFHVTNYQRVCHNPQESLAKSSHKSPGRRADWSSAAPGPYKNDGGFNQKKKSTSPAFWWPTYPDLAGSNGENDDKWWVFFMVESCSPVRWPHGGIFFLEKCPIVGSEHISVSLKSLEIWPKSDGDKSFLATVSPQTSPLKHRLEHIVGFFHPHQFSCLFMPIPIGSYWCHLERPVESHDFGLFGW